MRPRLMRDADLPPISIPLAGGRGYAVHFAPLVETPRRMAEAGLRAGRCLVVTDAHVAHHHLDGLRAALRAGGWAPKDVVIPPGEPSKSPAVLARIYDAALHWGIDRQTPVLALGGGVVGDLAGFAAATLLRGIPLVQLPTTLIAQVDSALGGKTGINHGAGKNLIGAFHQPRLVLADVATLETLPSLEWHSGLAEVVKHALLAGGDLFTTLETRWGDVLGRRPGVVAPMIHRAAGIKAAIVAEDEREQGRRALLNLGHTFGHALERTAGYGRFTHGEAVALGMRAAIHLSARLHPALPAERLLALVRRIPVRHGLDGLSTAALAEAMRTDKKVEAGRIRLVLLRALGDAYLTAAPEMGAIEEAWEAVRAEADPS